MKTVTVSQIMEKMIAFSKGNIHDIDHLIRVWTYAKTIGELEGLDRETQYILEAAAITHDIACPLCREKYGNTNAQISRVAFLVGHHHTFTDIDGSDYQILVEADYITNASENGYSEENIRSFMQKIMKTHSGKKLLQDVFSSLDLE